MTRPGWLGWVVCIIAGITILSGAVQMIRPAFVLDVVGAENGVAVEHFFGILGMFMLLFGGLAMHGAVVRSPLALLWAGLQKVGAVAAVVLGIRHSVFSLTALPIAGFDLVSGLLIIVYWRKVTAGGR